MVYIDPGRNSLDWWEVLGICRDLSKKLRRFKYTHLQEIAEFPDTKNGDGKTITGLQKASSWCAKLTKMKLLQVVGVDEDTAGPGRKPNIYEVSEAGWQDEKKPVSRLDRLLGLIGQLEGARGTPAEAVLYGKLFDAAHRIQNDLPFDDEDGKKRKGRR